MVWTTQEQNLNVSPSFSSLPTQDWKMKYWFLNARSGMILKSDKILIVAAHPDDETLGMGGSIAKFVSSKVEVSIVFVADGVTSRQSQRESLGDRKAASLHALSVLGVNDAVFLDLPDNMLDSVPRLNIIRELEKIISRYNPTIVFTNSLEDLNIDHRIVSECSIVATRPSANSNIRALLTYEVCSSTNQFLGKPSFAPNFFVDISDHLQNKHEALQAYRVELDPHPAARSVETILARSTYWGGLSGYSQAEAFKLSYFLYE